MQAIYDKAEELASLIISSKAYGDLRDAENAVEANAEVRKLIEEFNKQLMRMQEKEEKQQPIEPDEKHELQRLRELMQADEVLQGLLRAQMEYRMLMSKVNSILKARLERKG